MRGFGLASRRGPKKRVSRSGLMEFRLDGLKCIFGRTTRPEQSQHRLFAEHIRPSGENRARIVGQAVDAPAGVVPKVDQDTH